MAGFPVVAGPVLLVIGLEQGPAFAAQAARASLLAILANLAFSAGYSWAALLVQAGTFFSRPRPSFPPPVSA